MITHKSNLLSSIFEKFRKGFFNNTQVNTSAQQILVRTSHPRHQTASRNICPNSKNCPQKNKFAAVKTGPLRTRITTMPISTTANQSYIY